MQGGDLVQGGFGMDSEHCDTRESEGVGMGNKPSSPRSAPLPLLPISPFLSTPNPLPVLPVTMRSSSAPRASK